MSAPRKLMLVGCGDIGLRVAHLAREQNYHITGLVRSPDSSSKLSKLGFKVVEANLFDATSLTAINCQGSAVIYLAPPPGGGITDPKVRNFCATISPGNEPEKIVYISTSGVYGNCQGATVTETTPPNPQSARAKRRFDAETIFRQFSEQRNVPLVILRVTGIYGPHRFPLHRLLERHPVLREAEASLTNRIHADDLARICLKALERGVDGEIFNVSDGQETTMTEYFNLLADAFHLPRPPQISMKEAQNSMAPLMLSYFQESRRMDNSKLLERLELRLLYPTLADGLKASLAEMLRENPDFFRDVLGQT
jgi:nucleoside-diphosphate-sugar epimerase